MKKSTVYKCKLIFLFIVIFSPPLFLLKANAQTKAYHVGPDDILVLEIYAGGEIQQKVDLTVSAQGIINVPFLGPIDAKGKTLSQLEKVITTPLARDYFVKPQVNVMMKEYHHLKYYISGAVNKPGLYETSSKITIMELIAKAGGVLSDRGNIAYIQRADTQPDEGKIEDTEKAVSSKEPTLKIDLQALLDRGDMSQNQMLKPGDVVYIPLEKSLSIAASKVYVEGEVKKPGVYAYQPGMTALNACILAGGFAEFAAPNRARIIRKKGDKQEVIKINLNDVKKGKIADVELKSGDLIHVPETWL